jgi:hypothetical protein
MNPFRRNQTSHLAGYRHAPPLTIRWAGPDDAEGLDVLAELDEAPIPPAPLMLGFVDDELWAAVSVSSGAAICDPFKPSAEVARLVAERGRDLTVPGRSGLGLAQPDRRPARVSLRARIGQSPLA